MAGRDFIEQLQLQRARRQSLQPARGLVVDLVTVHIYQLIVIRRQLHCKIQRFHAVFPRKLKVRDRTHGVCAQLYRINHQLLSVRIAQNALLRKCALPGLEDSKKDKKTE